MAATMAKLINAIMSDRVESCPSLESFFPQYRGYGKNVLDTIKIQYHDRLTVEELKKDRGVQTIEKFALTTALIHMVEKGLRRTSGISPEFEKLTQTVLSAPGELEWEEMKRAVKEAEEAASQVEMAEIDPSQIDQEEAQARRARDQVVQRNILEAVEAASAPTRAEQQRRRRRRRRPIISPQPHLGGLSGTYTNNYIASPRGTGSGAPYTISFTVDNSTTVDTVDTGGTE